MKKLLNIFVVILLLVGLSSTARAENAVTHARTAAKAMVTLYNSANKSRIIDNYMREAFNSAKTLPAYKNNDHSKSNPQADCIADNMQVALSNQYDLHFVPAMIEDQAIAMANLESPEDLKKISELFNSELGAKLVSQNLTPEEDAILSDEYGSLLVEHMELLASDKYKQEIERLNKERNVVQLQQTMMISAIKELEEKCKQTTTNN